MGRPARGSVTAPALVVGVGLTLELLLSDVPPFTRIVLDETEADPFITKAVELFELT